MPAHFGEFIQSKSSPGVSIIPQKRKVKPAIEGLILLWMASEAEEYVNSIRNLFTWSSSQNRRLPGSQSARDRRLSVPNSLST
jgi:hypothetical protein